MCWTSALHTCLAHLILWLLNVTTISGPLNRVAGSLFDLISYPSSSFIFDPDILRNILSFRSMIDLFSSDAHLDAHALQVWSTIVLFILI